MKRNRENKSDPPAAAEFLRSMPQVNKSLETARRDDGCLTVTIPVAQPRFRIPILSWFRPYVTHRRVELDELGTSVYEMCDGRTVEKIVEAFAAAHKLTFREAQISVTTFLHQLSKRGIVFLVAKKT